MKLISGMEVGRDRKCCPQCLCKRVSNFQFFEPPHLRLLMCPKFITKEVMGMGQDDGLEVPSVLTS
jgi:hypothetical protein